MVDTWVILGFSLGLGGLMVRAEVPLMIGVSILLLAFSWNGLVGGGEGLFFVLTLVGYTILIIRKSRAESKQVEAEYIEAFQRPVLSTWLQAGWVVLGLLLLIKGSDLLVHNSIVIARSLGISELVIGLTLISGGTSLPEVATSIIAAARGERDIAVGNVVGSNLFNILAVLGITALVAPAGITVAPEALHFDLPVMIAVSVACIPVFLSGARISRGEGACLLISYLFYVAFLYIRD
jgi:cation:H+ antiporter